MASKAPSRVYFNISGAVGRAFTAVSDFDTDKMDMKDYDQGWLVYAERSETTGNPTWTIEHSYDGITFYLYDIRAKNLSIPDSRRESRFKPSFIRIKYEANGATGTVTLVIVRTNSV